ncbi:MAG: hypothetical protein ACFFCS_27525 [Candidatus Hodarchaeota archaeon]
MVKREHLTNVKKLGDTLETTIPEDLAAAFKIEVGEQLYWLKKDDHLKIYTLTAALDRLKKLDEKEGNVNHE